MRVLLAGGGYVASEVAQLLRGRGDEPLIVRRTPNPSFPFPQQAGDVTDTHALMSLPGTFDAVLYSVSPDRSDEAGYQTAWETGVTATLQALQERGDPIQRFVLLTSTAVYRETAGGLVDEHSPLDTESFRGKWMHRGETLATASPFVSCSLRLGGIYGPGRSGYLRRLKEGKVRFPNAARYSNRIHRDDAARAVVHCLDLEAPAEVFNVVDQDSADLREVIRFAASCLGCPLPEAEVEGSERPPGKRVSSKRLQDTDFSWTYPSYREGYRALLPSVLGG